MPTKKSSENPFSWCMPYSQQHKDCPKAYEWNGEVVSCLCDCHKKKPQSKALPKND